ncbi:MFS general substrate transporter [Lizonia empirigonia]|nr:MFS general substrate transporter [Lizonia empirigonia]
MSALILDAPFGQLVRHLTHNRASHTPKNEQTLCCPLQDENTSDLEKLQTIRTQHTARTQISRVGTCTALSKSISRADLEQQFSLAAVERGPSRPIPPETRDNGTVLVDWYTTADGKKPQKWLFGKKFVVVLQILMYTMGVYMGSAIYSPSIPGVMKRFSVQIGAASLGLSMYVLAYGIGPLLFSPLSEMPVIGRNPPYMVSYAIFVILLVPTALGPIISGFSVAAENWRWSLWEMLWMNGPIFLSFFFFLPETSSANILLRRAQRLRTLTGNASLKAQSEIDQASLTPRAIATEALWRPFQLMLLDPSIAFTAIYTAIIYGIFYSFFEAFPLVYTTLYGFNLGETGLTFLSVTIAVTLSVAWYWYYIAHHVNPDILLHSLGAPERRLRPRSSSRSSRASVHWVVSCIGIGITSIGIFLIIQCIFLYLPLSYPQYAASLFAGNDFLRSALAAGSIHFSTPMFHNLGVDRGEGEVAYCRQCASLEMV